MNVTDSINNDNNVPDQLDELNDEQLWRILDTCSNDIVKKPDDIIKKTERICNSCKSKNLIFKPGKSSYVCTDCGTETRSMLDESPEWNNYEDGKTENGRCGAPTSAFFPKSSLGTTINAPGYSKIKMIKHWGQVPYKEHSLGEILNEIDSKCKKYKITKAIIDNAKILYKKIRDAKHEFGTNKGKNVIVRGLNRKQIVAACFYFGAILQKYPRSTKEVADIFNLELKQVTKGCRKFLEIMKDNFIIFDIKPSHGTDFIERFGAKMKLQKNLIQVAKTISENTTKLDLASDHQATSLAAASILLAINMQDQIQKNQEDKGDEENQKEEQERNEDEENQEEEQKQVKDVSGKINKQLISKTFVISDVTISKTYKKIYPYRQIVISDTLTNKICHKINLKLMTNELENDIKIETDIENVQSVQSEDIHYTQETETDILIRKLKFPITVEPIITETSNQSEYSDCNQDIEINESDVIKKDDTLSKKDRIILQQHEKDNKRIIKIKLKDNKLESKRQEKEQKKELKRIEKQQSGTENMNLTESKKKRGRPRKQNDVINVNDVVSL
jgi:transcription initiation factor TFIIIB Brf1 subunit/transcription initiation factor TFIIB